jgi:hypothetical protein
MGPDSARLPQEMVPGRDSAPGWELGSGPAKELAQAKGSEMGQGSG